MKWEGMPVGDCHEVRKESVDDVDAGFLFVECTLGDERRSKGEFFAEKR